MTTYHCPGCHIEIDTYFTTGKMLNDSICPCGIFHSNMKSSAMIGSPVPSKNPIEFIWFTASFNNDPVDVEYDYIVNKTSVQIRFPEYDRTTTDGPEILIKYVKLKAFT